MQGTIENFAQNSHPWMVMKWNNRGGGKAKYTHLHQRDICICKGLNFRTISNITLSKKKLGRSLNSKIIQGTTCDTFQDVLHLFVKIFLEIFSLLQYFGQSIRIKTMSGGPHTGTTYVCHMHILF